MIQWRHIAALLGTLVGWSLTACVTVPAQAPGTTLPGTSTQLPAQVPVDKKPQPTVSYDANEAASKRLELAVMYMRHKDYRRAKTNLERAYEHAPNRTDILYAYGYYYELVAELELAEDYYRKAIKLSPDDPEAHNNYGAFLCGRGKYDEAEEAFLRAVEIPSYTKVASAYENAALCSLKAGETKKAKGYFAKALNHDPFMVNSLYQLSLMAYEEKDYEAARDYMRRYERSGRHVSLTLFLALRIEAALGNQDSAKTYRDMLLSRFPDSAEAKSLSHHVF